MDSYTYTIDEWQAMARGGKSLRVQLHPGLDVRARGARYGTVVRIGRKYVDVRLDVGGTAVVPPDRIRPIEEPDDDDGTLGPCGCTDYHMADCPTRTALGRMEAEETPWWDPYGNTWE